MPNAITSHDLPNQPMANVLGHQMLLHDSARDRFIAPSLLHAGCFEPFETELVINEVRPGDVVVDVGAHIGCYTLLLAALVGPKGKVFAFEPDPDNFTLLRRNVDLNGYANVELFNAAVADRPGRSRLYRSVDNAGDHRLHESPEFRQSVEVEVVALDDVLRDRGRIDFVKIDVHGSEGSVLEGMTGVIARSPRMKLIVEFWPAGLVRSGYGVPRFLEGIRNASFRVYEVDEATQSIRKVDPARLLAAHPVTGEGFTNLLCVKAQFDSCQK